MFYFFYIISLVTVVAVSFSEAYRNECSLSVWVLLHTHGVVWAQWCHIYAVWMQITSSYMIRSFSTSETCANGISYYLWLFWLFSCALHSTSDMHAPKKRGKMFIGNPNTLYTFGWNHFVLTGFSQLSNEIQKHEKSFRLFCVQKSKKF